MYRIISRLFSSFGVTPFLIAFLAAAPVLARAQILTEFHVNLLNYSMVFGITGMALALLLGYTGLLSFGHAAYFAVGAYAVAMGHKYLHIDSLEALLLLAIAASLLVSAFFGLIATRFTRIFFAIVTLSLTQVVWASTLKTYWITGGSDGIRVPALSVFGIGFHEAMSRPEYLFSVFYYYTLLVFIISVAIFWVILNSPFGRTLQAIRDNEVRAEFMGIKIKRYRWYSFIISGTFTGLAGALFAVLNGHVTPEIANWVFSGDIVFLTVLGGVRIFDGPLIGAIVFMFVRQYAMGYTIYWQFILGVVLVALVLGFSKGIMGTVYDLLGKAFMTKVTTISSSTAMKTHQ